MTSSKHNTQGALENFLNSRKSLMLATMNAEQLPEASTTPFIQHNNRFYIFVSQLATHTQNLQDRPKVSILLVDDEQNSANLFARKRVSYQCEAKTIERDQPEWETILTEFEKQQGKTVSLLKQLPDFILFELKAYAGQYVEGFGKAYRLSGETLDKIDILSGR